MKSSMKVSIVGTFALFAFLFVTSQTANAQGNRHITYQTFYDELSPYGDWVHHPRHGYVWVPYAEPGFQPYGTRGYWAMTEYGNTWVSDYEWGWAPFHYGRWFHDDYYGWSWVPGTEWGPSWVHWRHNNGYYGWAPLGPGIHISMNIHIPIHHWIFVPNRYITSHRIYNYYVPRRRVTHIYNNTVVINNVYVENNHTYISGPSRQDIERRTRRPVNVRTINYADRPDRSTADSRSVRIYRPAVSEESRTSARPSRVSEVPSRTSRTSSNNKEGQIDRSRTAVDRTTNTAIDRRGTTTESRDRTKRMSSDNTNGETSPSTSGTGNRESRTETRPAVKSDGSRTGNTSRESQSTRQETQRSAPVQRTQEVQRSTPTQRQEVQRSAPVQNRQEVQRNAPVQRRQEVQRTAPVQRQQQTRTTTSSPSRQSSPRQSTMNSAPKRETQKSTSSQRAPQSTQRQQRTR